VFLFNSRKNLDVIINEWDTLKDMKGLTLIFVNPFSLTETKWVLSPYLHNMMTDEHTLKTGLKSMFSMVEEISKEDANEKIK